ncbi:CYTH and CHAD domain-containing protein [Mycobacterium ostraviense]|uniref:CHAD domain-containing protein n=1 Tax=Mycobacterium ostraviense TaxID=2738409 RepID=A0A163XBC6_9MYCO|nr:CYTH and CHAD domain-containing protein [Mycobacterium ostraviense]KZS59194.1 CHAD domain-containing protein [Mycobacterium ostraviense]UGT93254.1 CYTH and CHAD domain-containing protein [Mycobacterium ostraviense]
MPVPAPKMARQLEVERKFDVVESTVSPSFDGIAAVARVEKKPPQELDAVYFDTPAQDLARNRITLRRRTGGLDAGWHLKLPAGPDARTEIHAPITGGDTVPAELLDVVLAIVRDRPVEPVARITTRRESQFLYGADGTALAEFCNDHVTAWSAGQADGSDTEPAEQQWREWELELIDATGATGDELLNRLSNRLLDAGAAPAGHGSKLARVLGRTSPSARGPAPVDPVHRAVAQHVEELLTWDRAVRADVDDAVHQMRVTTRKIRSLLREAPDSFGLADGAWVLDELRELAGVLGVARDAEVLAERYQRELDGLEPQLVRGPVRERLVEGARRRYQTGLRRSLIAMRSKRYFRLLDALDTMVAEYPVTTFGPGPGPATPPNIDAAYRRVKKAAKAAKAARAAHAAGAPAGQAEDGLGPVLHPNEALHRIRKRAKRLRYTAAATGADGVAQQAKAVQTLLGDHQDSVVSREHLLEQTEAAHAAGEDTFTYGLLYQQESDLAESCRAQLGAALRKLDKAVRKARR